MFSSCPQSAWVWLREAGGSTEQVRKLDIDLCDENGKVLVAMHGFSTRVLDEEVKQKLQQKEVASTKLIEPSATLIMTHPVWSTIPLPEKQHFLPAKIDQVVVSGGTMDQRD